jgi:anionic cell wall polymer biosynthesis LytR-Cps2A-Psr (LCP) family protein
MEDGKNAMDDEIQFMEIGEEDPVEPGEAADIVPETPPEHQPNRKKSGKRGGGARRKKHTARRVILILAAAALVLFAGWRIANDVGRSRLYGAQKETAPDLTETAAQGSTADQENWKSGWVNYNGKVMEYNRDILTFLFMGIDKSGPADAGKNGIDGGQSDGNFLLVVNPDTKQIDIIAINRNTMTDIDVYDEDGNYVGTGPGQICLQHGYGDGLQQSCERMEKAVSNLFYGLPISGYCSIGMDAVGAPADAVGGVTVPRMTYENGEIIYEEDETVTGDDAISFVHTRGNDYDAATYRLEKQKRFLHNFVAKLKSSVEKDPTSIVTLYNSIKDYIVSDIDMMEIVYLADHIGGYALNPDIYSMTGTTTPAEKAKTGYEEFVYDEQSLYDMIIEIYYREVDPDTGEVLSADGSEAVQESAGTGETASAETTEAAEGQ